MNHSQKYLILFLKYLWLVVLITASAAGLAWILVNKQPNVYGSAAVLEVLAKGDKDVLNIRDNQDDRASSQDALNTVVATLTSNDVMLATAQAIGRTAEWAAGSASGMVLPEKQNSLAQSVRMQLTVGVKRGTRLIEISAEDYSPAMAQKIAEQVVEQFLKLNTTGVNENSSKTILLLVEQENQLIGSLNDATIKRDEFAKSKNIDLAKALTDKRQAESMSPQLVIAMTRAASLDADLASLKDVPAGDLDGAIAIPSVAALPGIAASRAALIEREAQFAELRETYLEKHPKYIAALRALEERSDRLKKALDQAEPALAQQLDAANAAVKKLSPAADGLQPETVDPIDLNALENLQQNVTNTEGLLADVKKRQAELQVVNEVKKSPYNFVSKPLLNPKHLRPNKVKIVLIGTGLGLLLGSGLIFLLAWLDSSIRSVDEAERQFGLPVLAAVPETDLAIPKGGTVMTDAGGTMQAEAFRTLRASLSLIGDESKKRTVLVTSAIPSEGKTFCSINLAAGFAAQGYRTLLIDGDLRRPALTATLLAGDLRKGDQYRGLSDVLTSNSTTAEAIQTLPIENLFIMPSGRRPPNPSELLSQPKFAELLGQLRTQYDRIVLDTAPINAVSDTLGFCQHIDSTILILRAGKTPGRAFTRALQLLQKAGAVVSGLVLNRIPKGRGAAYYYYYYGDSYLADTPYGGTSEKKKKKSKKQNAAAPDAVLK